MLTCDWLPDLDPAERPVVPALRDLGLDVSVEVWTDPSIDWGAFDLLFVRCVWDYFNRHDEWVGWTRRVEGLVPVANPPDTLRWNSAKDYLRDLAETGVRTLPTTWLERGASADLPALLAERGIDDAILKPTVGGGSLGLHRVDPADPGAAQAHLDSLLAAGDVMVEPFLPSIVERGELSVVCLDGRPSHAVRKTPRAGDIRVQPEHGGHVEAAEPEPDEWEQVERVLAAVSDRDLAYARVDLVRDGDSRPALIELEAIEPRLFMDHSAGAAERVARTIAARL
ncbi:MAG TPA: hypothetical protein VNT32_09090 [Thermoleophilaceae bacterium]|nr:hypothetical protein [Thermoleophilaceae bacterium]